jgi:hypothetical protein
LANATSVTMPEATRDVTFPSIAFYGRGVVYEP